MRKITRTMVALGVTTASAVTFTATPALAATYTASAANWRLTDLVTTNNVICPSSNISGTVSTLGTPPVSVTTATTSSCTAPLGITLTNTFATFPWTFTWTSVLGSVTSGTLSRIHMHFSGLACSMDVDGPGGATSSSGVVNAAFTSGSPWTLAFSGGNLRFYNVSGVCPALFHNGDAAALTVTYS